MANDDASDRQPKAPLDVGIVVRCWLVCERAEVPPLGEPPTLHKLIECVGSPSLPALLRCDGYCELFSKPGSVWPAWVALHRQGEQPGRVSDIVQITIRKSGRGGHKFELSLGFPERGTYFATLVIAGKPFATEQIKVEELDARHEREN